MKKIIFTSLFLFASNLSANDISFFGIDLNINKSSVEINKETKSDKFNSFGLKLGYMSNERRHYISYAKRLDYDNINYTDVLYNYDLFLKRFNKFTPYIGVHAGLGILQYNNQEQLTFDYGVKAGLLHDFMYNSHLDFGLKYSNTNSVYIGDRKLNDNLSLYLGYTFGFDNLLY